jgi:flagellin-like hook-associated protein FlgL
MRVTFNSFPDTLLGRLQSLGKQQNNALTELSTGQRLAAPSDDAPAMQRILNLRTEKKQNQQYHRNATDGLEVSKVTFSSLEQIKDLLVRSSELSANVSGATSEQEFKAKASEIDQLIQQGLNVANTKLRGNSLFSGNSTLINPFTPITDSQGSISAISYKGSDTALEVRIGEGDKSTISVASTSQENGSIAGLLNEMVRLRDAMKAISATKVQQIRTSGGEKTNFVDPLGPQKSFLETSQTLSQKYDLGLTEIEYEFDPQPYPQPTLNGGVGNFLPIPQKFINLGLNSPQIAIGDKINLDLAAFEGQGLGGGDFYIVGKQENSIALSQTRGGEPIFFTSNITSASKISKFEGIEYPSTKIKLPVGHDLTNGDKIKLELSNGEGAPLTADGKYFIKNIDQNGFAELSETENGQSILINEPLTASSKFKKIKIEYPNDKTLLPNPHDLKVGDKIKVDFAPNEAEGLESGVYFVSDIITTAKGQFLKLSSIPGGPAVVFQSDITEQSNFQRVGGLQEIEDTILSALSRAGTIQYRLETAMKDLEVRYEGTEKLISTDADIDFAEATVRLNRAQMAYQAAIQSGARIQSNSLLDYLR